MITYQSTPSIIITEAKLTAWAKYRKYISSLLDLKIPLKIEHDIDEAVYSFKKIAKDAALISTPATKNNDNSIIYTPDDIAKLIAEKRSARRNWVKHRSPSSSNQPKNYRKLSKTRTPRTSIYTSHQSLPTRI